MGWIETLYRERVERQYGGNLLRTRGLFQSRTIEDHRSPPHSFSHRGVHAASEHHNEDALRTSFREPGSLVTVAVTYCIGKYRSGLRWITDNEGAHQTLLVSRVIFRLRGPDVPNDVWQLEIGAGNKNVMMK
jgi:hypothetical protein